MDPAQVGSNLGGVFAVATLTALLKVFIEQRCGTTGALHDTLIRGTALLIGITFAVVDFLGKHGYTFTGLETAVESGFLSGTAAVLVYHLVSGSLLQSNGDSADPPTTALAAMVPMSEATKRQLLTPYTAVYSTPTAITEAALPEA